MHTILLLFCFNHETPFHLYLNSSDESELSNVLSKFYSTEAEIEARKKALKDSC